MFYNILGFVYSFIDSCQWLEGRHALTAHLNMSRHVTKTAFIGILLCVLLLSAATALAADDAPITVRAAEPSPKVLSGPGTVQVSISISNTSDSSTPVTVTLLDPNGNICTGFGSGGTVSLGQGETRSYTGSWSVTEKQLNDKKIIYSASFKFQNEEGQPVPGTRPIPISISYNNAVAELDVQRVPPTPKDGTVVQGQTVTLAYQLKNTGTIDLTDITITDPNISEETVTIPVLKPGETQNASFIFVAGATTKTSEAKVTYKFKEGSTTKSRSATQSLVLNVTVPELVVTLKADKQVVNPGTKITLTYTISNKGTLKYEQIKITDPLINEVESGITLEPGKEYTNTREVTVNATGTYQLTVTGTSSAGPISIMSEPVIISTTADGTATSESAVAIPVEMTISVEADREIIYSEPSDVVFRIIVTNNGTTTLKNVNVTERGKTVKTIPEIQPSASFEFTKRFTVSFGGVYQFAATAKDNLNQNQSVTSEEIRLSYKPAPTLPPTQAPPSLETMVPVMTEAPQDVDNQSLRQQEPTSFGTVLLYILAVLLVVVLMAVGVLVILEKRRSGPQTSMAFSGQGGATVIDSIQRSPHRDYARAPKRVKLKATDEKTKSKLPKEEPEMPAEEMPDPVLSHVADEATSEKQGRKSRKADSSESAEPREDQFKRPEPKQDVAEELAASFAQEDVEAATMEPEDRTDYLGSIRKGRRGGSTETSETKDQSDADMALLSGSTGQYRLSRETKSSIPSAKPKVQDAETFSRRQRAARAQSLAPMTDFYEDDEEDLIPLKNKKKRKA